MAEQKECVLRLHWVNHKEHIVEQRFDPIQKIQNLGIKMSIKEMLLFFISILYKPDKKLFETDHIHRHLSFGEFAFLPWKLFVIRSDG